jgi:tetratricopeptide (TPR) repeat protein
MYLTSTGRLDSMDASKTTIRQHELLRDVREAIAINPNYRKLNPVVADHLAMHGDWANAVWIWESASTSRPYVAAFWYNLANGYLHLEQYQKSQIALDKLFSLQEDAPGARALEVRLLSRTGHAELAFQKLTDYFDQTTYDYDLLTAGFDIGRATHNWTLAIRALELRKKNWPSEASDVYFKMGHIFSETELHDEAKALTAFRAGFEATPNELKVPYRQQVPEKYRLGL